ncbi:DUF3427 domain-containing protein [Aestuariirhabdus sp. LZHN29]|uniref:DUF3427 domain-containing protein n=1 Tax=Aestuariirhabdus sp. LZHN29 TaxID=3417462 RepID=UPI003CF43F9D
MTVFDKYLSTGGDDHFLPNLVEAINRAQKIDITVAFIRQTGLSLLMEPLLDALDKKVSVRILTGDYLYITDPEALHTLLLLGEQGADVRVFESKNSTSFHMKAYIFIYPEDCGACAFVGSSNITRSALQQGLEWNLRVDQAENPRRFREICEGFDAIFQQNETVPLTQLWVEDYQRRYSPPAGRNGQFAPGSDEVPELVTPNDAQQEALDNLAETREAGYQRGLVVMATGMGKTWLAAFDSKAMNAKRVLFVAHREEILLQAEATFIRIHSDVKVGRYSGQYKEVNVDMLFASVQTLGRQTHLDQFPSNHFDYIVVDEFHHAAARTYLRLLAHFQPRFMLGLTATPERTDQSDILSLCDNNLVFCCDLFDGIESQTLSPFEYYGIGDETVDYQEISWRNSRFDPNQLVNQLATLARANHALKEWSSRHQSKTLAFCISQKHADFMAHHFNRNGVKSLSVHSGSDVRRNDAISQLEAGRVSVIFSVDLFNEGVDIPSVDTVLMLRPTESKIVFLQQLGRGLRRYSLKEKLVVLDFIGNHQSFFNKAEALFKIGASNRERKDFLKRAESETLELPAGCFVNYDLSAIDIMRSLISTKTGHQLELYRSLKDSLGRRPSLSAFYQAGGSVETIRKEYGQWFIFVKQEGDLSSIEVEMLAIYEKFLYEVETTSLTRSFKMVLLEAFLEMNGFSEAPSVELLARKSFDVLKRRPTLNPDLPNIYSELTNLDGVNQTKWVAYWKQNPINAWIGGNRSKGPFYFSQQDGNFSFTGNVVSELLDPLYVLTQELVNYRFLSYEVRLSKEKDTSVGGCDVVPLRPNTVTIPYFTDLKIACGFFRTSAHDIDEIEQYQLPESYGHLDPARHFVARASGDSMNGGKNPIRDGDYLLLEAISSDSAGSISNQTVAIQRRDVSGDDQYLLRKVNKVGGGHYQLIAQNPAYEPMMATDEMNTFARFKALIDPVDLFIHRSFMREEIPSLFGLEFNTGLWQNGHVRPKGHADQYLFVTLNNQGRIKNQKFHDYFIDSKTLHWESQNSVTPSSSKGKAIIEHALLNSNVHLFVRKHRLIGGKGAPFYYCGPIFYRSHKGQNPMSVVWDLKVTLSEELSHAFID